ncbi:MAG TPA: aspartate aminotransferase family protein [Candidatus Hydrogenedentes bacterium]|nr:aspartate aminotransferase family protein [Candidatus Hydrogenedentota bacterium]HPG67064.1 aspartate aminotransferase family protein [Candidatus Hydrogenedentota bacterium]
MADPTKSIPRQGIDREKILAEMQTLSGQDANWRDARTWSLVFHHSDPHSEFLKKAHNLFFDANGLNPLAFKSLKTFETDVVRMAANLFHGDRNVVGVMTSGGTESIMLAVRTYRDWARARRPRIKRPEMVVPDSVHVAFDKAGAYFDVDMVRVPLTKDYLADVDAMARRISRNTIALVGSACCYPYGTVDPIEAIAAVAQTRGLACHVDACVGGFFLPFLERIDPAAPRFDYRIPGVTSISADVHKYGYAAKGASTITYRSIDYLKHQFFAQVDWAGGVYASATIPGTRPGGSIAAAWATLHALGEDGFVENVRNVMAITRKLQEGIRAIPGLEIVGRPPMSLFAYQSTDPKLNIYAVGDFLERRGWHIDRQQKPASLHAMVNPNHAAVADQYLADLHDAVAYVRAHPDAAVSGSAPAYGVMFKTPLRGLVKKNVLKMMEAMYSAESEMPDLGSADVASGDDDAPPKPTAPPGIPKSVFALMKIWNRIARR